MRRLIGARWFWAIPVCLTLVGVATAVVGAVNVGGGRGLFSMVFLFSLSALLGVARVLDRFVDLMSDRLIYLRDEAPFVLNVQARTTPTAEERFRSRVGG